jgi:hypothetical protein
MICSPGEVSRGGSSGAGFGHGRFLRGADWLSGKALVPRTRDFAVCQHMIFYQVYYYVQYLWLSTLRSYNV